MTDPLAAALARLAPAVDAGASRELFERDRDGGAAVEAPRPGRRRWSLAAACVVLLVAGVGGVWALAGRDEPAPGFTSTPTSAGNGTEFQVIAVEPVADPDARSIRAAGTYDDLVSIVSRFGPTFAPKSTEVDFDTQIALVFERPGASSPDELARFDATADAWIARFERPTGDIEDVGLGYVYLVAVKRSALAGIQSFVMPAEPRGNVAWDELRVAVPGAQPAPEPAPVVADAAEDAFGTLLFETAGTTRPGAVLIASSQRDVAPMWERVGIAAEAPQVDFERSILVLFTVVDDACAASFGGLSVGSAADPAAPVVRPLLVEDDRDLCGESAELRSFVVLVDRSRLPRRFTFAFPDEYAGDGPVRTAIDVNAGFVVDLTVDAEFGIEPGRVLLIDDTSNRFAQVLAADDPSTYAALWAQLGSGSPQPEVDFERDIVVAFVIPDDACPPEFDGFDTNTGPDGSIWTPVLRETSTACRLPLVNRLVLVAVGREQLVDSVTFRLPANPVDGYDEQLFPLVIPSVVTLVERACGPTDGPALAVQLALVTDDDALVEVRRGEDVLGTADVEAGTAVPISGRFVQQVLVPLASSAAIGDEVLVRTADSDTPPAAVIVDGSMLDTTISCG